MNRNAKRRTLWWFSGLLLAVPCLANAESLGTPAAFLSGWTAYEQGDYHAAVEYWRPLAEQGHVSSQINLAVMYDHGYGVDQNAQRAAGWYEAAARQNSMIAQYNFGLFLAERRSLSSDGEGALYWLLKAAEQGYADAQYQLGLRYADGAVGETGLADASQWLYRAGLSYLSGDDREGAHAAVAALNTVAPGGELAVELETRLTQWSQSEQPAGSSAV